MHNIGLTLLRMKLEEGNRRLEIGKGRSGTVFRSSNSDDNDIAIKVFTGEDSLTKIVNYIFTGAPNSYSWNEDAVQSAYYRRCILGELVPYWTDSRVRVAKALGVNWNSEFKAYELQTELIEGRYASLHHPFSSDKFLQLLPD